MNILFLTMNVFTSIEMHNIYSDLMKAVIAHGHKPYIVTPREKKSGEKTELLEFSDHAILKVQTGNTSDVSFIEKGISTVTMDGCFYRAIRTYLRDVSFDLILYSTPPITLCGTIGKLKRKFGCRTYLMLKDIFPQNAVDLAMFRKGSLIWRYFRSKEKKLYRLSDKVGCMSPANVEYLLKHNPEIDRRIVIVCPNSIAVSEKPTLSVDERLAIRKRYGIPSEAVVFVYGGNLGKPQDIPFIIRCLQSNADKTDRFFVICGTGSEYPKLEEYVKQNKPQNVLLQNGLPHEEYIQLVRALDVGLIFLDHRFAIPNFPSRLLSYMECGLPVLACTDPNTDIGQIIEAGGFGWWCESDDPTKFTSVVDEVCKNVASLSGMGEQAAVCLKEHYDVKNACDAILN